MTSVNKLLAPSGLLAGIPTAHRFPDRKEEGRFSPAVGK